MVEVIICVGSSCHLKGAKNIVDGLQRIIKDRKLETLVSLSGSFCMGACSEPGVSVKIGKERFYIDPENVENFFDDEITKRLEASL